MKWVVRGAGGSRDVEVERSGDAFDVLVGDRRLNVDLICLDGAVASLRFVDSGRSFHVTFQRGRDHQWRVAVGEREFDLSVLTPVAAVDAVAAAVGGGPSRLEAPIPGKVVAINVAPGDEVEAGQSMIVLEAMKMENELTAEQPGRVAAVHVESGTTVDAGTLLVELE